MDPGTKWLIERTIRDAKKYNSAEKQEQNKILTKETKQIVKSMHSLNVMKQEKNWINLFNQLIKKEEHLQFLIHKKHFP